MFNDDNGRPRGSAIVDFESSEMAQKAIEKMHRMEVKGRKLVVKEVRLNISDIKVRLIHVRFFFVSLSFYFSIIYQEATK